MATTHIVKFDESAVPPVLTMFCMDDSGETEIGPMKWDDANNQMEIHCDADHIGKFAQTGNRLEVRGADCGCTGETISGGCCGGDCDVMPRFYSVTIDSTISDCAGHTVCGNYSGEYIIEGNLFNCSWENINNIRLGITNIYPNPGSEIDFRIPTCYQVNDLAIDAFEFCGTCTENFPMSPSNENVSGDCPSPFVSGYGGSVTIAVA